LSLLATKLQKIQKYYVSNLFLHFARQDGQDEKERKINHANQVTKIPKTKRRIYGMNKTYEEGFYE
jgi:hypothetical protein